MTEDKLALQIAQRLKLQNDMNSKVHPQWREQKFPFYRAIWTECAELLDHYGWKWWKKQEADIEQIQLEIVDIWHFGLSIKLQNTTEDDSTLAKQLAQELSQATLQCNDFRLAIEAMASSSLAEKAFDIKHFSTLMQLADLSTDMLFQQYVGKNVLNFFRQDHGYKDGSYIKLWNEKEDNEHLAEIVASLNSASGSFPDDVYNELKARYTLVLN